MNLVEFLNSPEPDHWKPEEDTETDWLHLADLVLRGTHVQVADRQMIGVEEEGVVVPVIAGVYEISCRVKQCSRQVTQLRVALKGCEPAVGESIGELDVDFGSVGMGDFDLLQKAAEQNEDEYQDWIEAIYEENESDTGIVFCPLADTEIPFVQSGQGDGTYRALELVADGKCVGLHVHF